MKREKKQNRIEYYAEQVMKLERDLERNIHVEESEQKISDIMSKLTLEETELLDDYIMRKTFH